MTDPAKSWQRTFSTRVLVAAGLFASWVVAIELQLVRLQIVEHDDWVRRAKSQQLKVQPMPARRGDVLDRKGFVLATSVDSDDIFADPTEIKDPQATASALCRALRTCTAKERDVIAESLSHRDAHFVYVRRANRVLPEEVARVADLKLKGIGFRNATKREYPNNELAAHLLGYVGTENTGLNGIEAAYEPYIRGKDGKVLIQTDGARGAFGTLGEPATPGSTLQLTIDEYLQHLAERELRNGVRENNAAGGSAIIMDPRTGEILAMANEPTFDPNNYGLSPEEARINRAIQNVYEPGSTFKMVTASAALEEHVMTPDVPIDVSGGRIQINRARVVRDTHAYGVLSFTDVIVKSSNVGAIKIGFRLGAERLGRYVQRFGFGARVCRELKGESSGIVYDPSTWRDSDLASVSMGYQISVTPLQMAAAASVIANGGELMQARIVKAVISPDGVRQEFRPQVVRRAILNSTADQLTAIMEGVVERGTATAAKIPGYTIAGKTGTAAKLEANHTYSRSNYNASFVGFIPSRKPALVIIVVIDSPHGHGYYGGVVSAPVFKRIAENAIRYLGIPPSVDVQPLLVTRNQQARTVQFSPALPGDRVQIVRTVAPDASAPGTVPDVVGLSLREATRVLARFRLTPRPTGTGVVIQQDPPPGTPVEPDSSCTLTLGRPVPVAVGSDQRQ